MDAGCGTKVETLVETEQDGIGDTLHNSCVMIMKRQCRTEVEMAPYLKVNARCAGARSEIRIRRQHELLDGSRRREPGHSVCVRGEIRIRRQHELLDGSRRQEPGHSAG